MSRGGLNRVASIRRPTAWKRQQDPPLRSNSVFVSVGMRVLWRASPPRRQQIALLHPIRDEHVGLVRLFAVAVGGPDQALAIGGEHREGVEVRDESDALLSGAVLVDDVEIEVAAALGFAWFEAKMMRLPSGWKKGAKLAAPLCVT